jgi:hypothetical protein
VDDDQKIVSQSKLLCEFIEFICTAEPSLGFSQNPISIELKSLIMAQIERWRQA